MLFPARPAAIEDAMPSPRKARKSKHPNPFAIADESSSSKIEIYTDSKDRIPDMEDDDANPFLSKNASKPSKRQTKKVMTAHEEEMEEAARNDEGVIYVL
jgi:hypothetical protein